MEDIFMKIKSILAGIAAAGTVCAVSASAFADDVVLVSAPVDEDIYIAPGDDMLEIKVAEQFKKLFADEISDMCEKMKLAIEAAGGIEDVVNNAMEQVEGKTSDELKAAFFEQLQVGNIPEEQLEQIMEFYNSGDAAGAFTPETYRESITGLLTAIQNTESVDALIDAMFLMMDEADLKEMSKALDEYEANLAGKADVTGGDNADTGVEGVAAVVGVIAVAGAVVVISRKRA